jgi:uncharacterized protein
MNTKKVIWIAGGDGLVGKHLIKFIDKTKYQIVVLSRKERRSSQEGIHFVTWDTENHTISQALKPDHIINLAGAGIADARWSEGRKKILVSSRVNSGITIQKYLEVHNIKPQSYISASAVGFYGHRNDEILTEESKPGNEFMSDCCIQWEDTAFKAGSLCERTVVLRIGIVLTSLGGALPKMLMTRNFGLFNYFGNGNQFYPWIHISDLSRLIIASIEQTKYDGIYNAVAPQEITNKAMMSEIMKVNNMTGILLPAPAIALNLLLGEMSAVVLNSNRVSSKKLQDQGFVFQFSNAGEAVFDVLKNKY